MTYVNLLLFICWGTTLAITATVLFIERKHHDNP